MTEDQNGESSEKFNLDDVLEEAQARMNEYAKSGNQPPTNCSASFFAIQQQINMLADWLGKQHQVISYLMDQDRKRL